ncbi:nuclear GTPase SLIP-GC, partial [Ascaphus truei]|uniref:nuclear GTPase SLIP-GC n=1 Tax=Ascaphus truei TaxID=8439 RepID=UPI003F59941E
MTPGSVQSACVTISTPGKPHIMESGCNRAGKRATVNIEIGSQTMHITFTSLADRADQNQSACTAQPPAYEPDQSDCKTAGGHARPTDLTPSLLLSPAAGRDSEFSEAIDAREDGYNERASDYPGDTAVNRRTHSACSSIRPLSESGYRGNVIETFSQTSPTLEEGLNWGLRRAGSQSQNLNNSGNVMASKLQESRVTETRGPRDINVMGRGHPSWNESADLHANLHGSLDKKECVRLPTEYPRLISPNRQNIPENSSSQASWVAGIDETSQGTYFESTAMSKQCQTSLVQCKTEHIDGDRLTSPSTGFIIISSDSEDEKPVTIHGNHKNIKSENTRVDPWDQRSPRLSWSLKRKRKLPSPSAAARRNLDSSSRTGDRSVIVIDSDEEIDVKEEVIDEHDEYVVGGSTAPWRERENVNHSTAARERSSESIHRRNVNERQISPDISSVPRKRRLTTMPVARSPVLGPLHNPFPVNSLRSASPGNIAPPATFQPNDVTDLMNYRLPEKLHLPSPFPNDLDFFPPELDSERIYSDEERPATSANPITAWGVHRNCPSSPQDAEDSGPNVVSGEPPPSKDGQDPTWASTEQDVMRQLCDCRSVLGDIARTLDEIQDIDDPTMKQWRSRIAALSSQAPLPRTRIAVVGDTGAGKSSLLNALLEEEDVLPTSAMRACTAAVVEICKSSEEEDGGYRAEVTFLSEEEWDSELQLLITDMKDKSGKFKKRPDSKSAAGVAYSRVKAVYGHIAELNVLKQNKEVTQHLGTVKSISEYTASAFRSAIEKFIDSQAEEKKQRAGGEFWPIVKCVKVFVPRSEVLRTGAVLVDLPGTRDSNAARDGIANDYLRRCDAVWVVTNITRAVDDKTANEMLSNGLRRQLYMDGRCKGMAVICTKTDLFSTREIIRALKLEADTGVLEEDVREAGNRLTRLEAEKKALYEQWNKGETGQREKDPRDEMLEKDKEISLLQRQKEENLRNIKQICVQARNRFSKRRIREDFHRSLRELGRWDPEGEEEEEDEDSSNAEETPDPFSLRVFTVSSKEYLDLRRRDPQEGRICVFNTEEDTEIPALRDLAVQTALRCSMLAAGRVVREMACIISDVITYLTNRQTLDDRHQTQVQHAVQSCLSELKKQLDEAVCLCDNNMMHFLNVKIRSSLDVGVRQAEEVCEVTVQKWGSRESGGYPYPTYRAACSRLGAYSSAACGVIDFNEQLTEPLTGAVTKSWSEVF